jgi:hypothetical protein
MGLQAIFSHRPRSYFSESGREEQVLEAEFTFHLINCAILTVVVSPFVLWRYRVTVLKGMTRGDGKVLPPSGPQLRDDDAAAGTGAAPKLLWEKRRQRDIALAYLLTTLICALPLALASTAIFYLEGKIRIIYPSNVLQVVLIYALACVPMIVASLALPPLQVFAGLVLLTISFNVLHEASYLVEVALVNKHLSWGRLGPTDFLGLAASQMWLIALFWLTTWPRRVRGVAPITFSALLLFGLGPFIGSRITAALGRGHTLGLNGMFVLMALPAGWLAWKRLHQLARGYERKRFSDAQLLSRTCWLILAVNVGLQMATGSHMPSLAVVASAASLFIFAPVNAFLLARIGRAAVQLPPRNLLLLRVFGYTARSERLFDRVGARWRLFGPVTTIAAPDVVARTIGPGDYLRWLTGRADELFVTSGADLAARLAALDMAPDPDGRYRVNALCCRDNTWQATVVELMQRADVVLMDVRRLSRDRHGCEFELQQLAQRLPPQRLVFVVDVRTERAILEAAFGQELASIRLIEVSGSRNTKRVFEALLEAAA